MRKEKEVEQKLPERPRMTVEVKDGGGSTPVVPNNVVQTTEEKEVSDAEE